MLDDEGGEVIWPYFEGKEIDFGWSPEHKQHMYSLIDDRGEIQMFATIQDYLDYYYSSGRKFDAGLHPSQREFQPLLDWVRQDGRVCPAPGKWNEFWKKLRKIGPSSEDRDLPRPLILGAWNLSDAEEKRSVLARQIEYATAHGASRFAEGFLMALRTDQWVHDDEL